MPGFDRKGSDGAYLRTLTEGEVEHIHESALKVLSETGIVVWDDEVLTLLADAGCRVEREQRHVRLPAAVVGDAAAEVPPTVTLYNRLGEEAMAVGAGPLYTRTSSGATGILDLDTGQRREATSQDAADAARLADALPRIHGVSTMAVQPADVPVATVDLHTVRLALANTIKPLGYVCLNEELVEPVLSMFAAVVGGEDALQERPILTALAESTSPLRFVPSQLAVVRAFATRGLPLTLHAHPMAGLTSPVTLAGELVITHAEVLALTTIAQLERSGTPVIYGMSSSVPDMRNGANLSGAPEIALLGAAVAQLARRVGLPSIMSTGTDAHRPGPQAALERLITLMLPALAGIDLVNLSTLETKTTFSPEQLVIDDTILSIVERSLRGITVDEETMALELIHKIGPGGAFVAAQHTLRHFRDELLIPELISREPRRSWQASGKPDMRARARKKARRILAEHHPPRLTDDVVSQLDEIVRETKKQT
ncbi:MAG: trimethylamine methyltransferase family protein [Anaerolineae bacterium]|jgi:trimethylamine--corrinoid protein Co-methyltransferase